MHWNIPFSIIGFLDSLYTVCKSLIALQLPVGKGIDILFFYPVITALPIFR